MSSILKGAGLKPAPTSYARELGILLNRNTNTKQIPIPIHVVNPAAERPHFALPHPLGRVGDLLAIVGTIPVSRETATVIYGVFSFRNRYGILSLTLSFA